MERTYAVLVQWKGDEDHLEDLDEIARRHGRLILGNPKQLDKDSNADCMFILKEENRSGFVDEILELPYVHAETTFPIR